MSRAGMPWARTRATNSGLMSAHLPPIRPLVSISTTLQAPQPAVEASRQVFSTTH